MSSRRHRRLVLLVIAVVAVALLIGGRLYELQALRCDELRDRATNQHQRRLEVDPIRGAILDRRGRKLAVSVATQALFVHPRAVEDPVRAAELLSPELGISRSELLERIRSDKPFVWLHRALGPDQVEAVRAAGIPIGNDKPFGLLPSSKRTYPHGHLGVHVVGFVDIDGVGIEGVEKRLDETLRGDPSVYLVLQDARDGVLRKIERAPDRLPRNVVLTLDLTVQHIVERELDRALRDSGAETGSAVVLDPTTGGILALANRPTLDANHARESRPEQTTNRAVVLQYEPGSTFKIVPMAAALEHGRVRPDQSFDCENGSYALGSRRIRDSKPHGVLSARETIEKSSNICMVKIARRIGPELLHRTIREFGFGQRTGIELPGELRGTLHPVPEWNRYTWASLAFGQEITVTVLQMAEALSVVANNGLLVPPRILAGRRGTEGRLLPEAKPETRRVISARTARELTAMLEGVIAGGTGVRAGVPGYRLAGKTGTAQKVVGGTYSETEYVASFGGFGPLPDPRLVVLVVLDSPRYGEHHGGQAAGPAFARIMRDALSYLRAPRDGEALAVSVAGDLNGPAPRGAMTASTRGLDRVATPAIRGRVPDVTGLSLREAVSRLAASGFRSLVEGSGVVASQHPQPGAAAAPGAVCRLRLVDARPVDPAAPRGIRH